MSATFHHDLPTFPSLASAFDSQSCRPVPDDWNVLAAVVRGAEVATEQGRYRDVNAVAVASIAAIRNGFSGQDFPVMFGGDSVTFCVPENALENARALLLDCQQLARREFDLDLRIGAVPVSLLRELGTDVCVGRLKIAEGRTQVMITGEGLNTAEELVKGSHQFLIQRSRSSLQANFTGFRSRFDEIPSPAEENICLLVRAVDPSELERTLTYSHVLQLIESIYGAAEAHHPIDAEDVKFRFSPGWLRNEARVCNPGYNRIGKAIHLLSVLPQVGAGGNPGGDEDYFHRAAVRNNSQRCGFDDQLRMIMAGTVEQRAKLRGRLMELHNSGRVVFGIHAGNGSLITSVVGERAGDQVHYIDGSGGGYAMAALEMKAQLRALEARQQRMDAETGESLAAELRRRSENFRKDRRETGVEQIVVLPLAAKESRQERVGLSPL